MLEGVVVPFGAAPEGEMSMRRIVVVFSALAMLAVIALPAGASGATQISGVAVPGDFDVCSDAVGADADSVLQIIEGDLIGCLYAWWDPAVFRPSGTYNETGDELFVGCLADGETCGTFEIDYRFTAKFADDDFSGQVFGRCQHPIVEGTGTGDFEGITGRIDFKDDLDAGIFDMRGHISLP